MKKEPPSPLTTGPHKRTRSQVPNTPSWPSLIIGNQKKGSYLPVESTYSYKGKRPYAELTVTEHQYQDNNIYMRLAIKGRSLIEADPNAKVLEFKLNPDSSVIHITGQYVKIDELTGERRSGTYCINIPDPNENGPISWEGLKETLISLDQQARGKGLAFPASLLDITKHDELASFFQDTITTNNNSSECIKIITQMEYYISVFHALLTTETIRVLANAKEADKLIKQLTSQSNTNLSGAVSKFSLTCMQIGGTQAAFFKHPRWTENKNKQNRKEAATAIADNTTPTLSKEAPSIPLSPDNKENRMIQPAAGP